MDKKYTVVETMGTLVKDSNYHDYEFSITGLEAEKLVFGFDFKPHESKRVKVIIMIGEEE